MRLTLLTLFSLVTTVAFTQPPPPPPPLTLSFTAVPLSGPTLVNPVDITGCGDGSGRLFVVEKRGDIRIIQNGAVLNLFFLDIRDSVETGGERGLLGLAFHPSYPDSPYVFVNYVKKGTIITQICRFKLNPNNSNDLDESSKKTLITQSGVQTNHKAGDLAFGPDGYLYFGLGDGGGGGDPGENGQNINSLLGKILRIDINVGVPPYFGYPPDNPFVGVNGNDAIWLYGMRNPWRISFDRLTGDFYIGDVGQDLWEEVDMLYAGNPGGYNMGWDCKEGNHVYESTGCPADNAFTWPVFEYPHSCNNCPTGTGTSMTGGFVYRGTMYPSLIGYYVCADYGSNNVWTLKQTGFGNPPVFSYILHNQTGISAVESFGEDDNGELYALSYGGTVYSVGGTGGPLDIQWTNITANSSRQGNKIDWTLDATFGINHFEVQRSYFEDFHQFLSIGEVSPDPGEIHYHFNDPFTSSAGSYYRIAAHLEDGSTEYSPLAHILPDPVSRPVLIHDVINNILKISLPDNWQKGDIVLYDLQGRVVFSKRLSSGPLAELPSPRTPGCYFVVIRANEGIWSDKIVWSPSNSN